jgi:geranylgeranyl diphosphate synthase type II
MVDQFESFCEEEFLKQKEGLDPAFYESLEYSFFSGGKRFRPRLILALSKDLNVNATAITPAAMAVELIHTYSLIHDDLPAMDDDEYRRGKLSHHAKYGEASAVLAGDALLTLAFEELATHYSGAVLKNLILKLSKCAGAGGMVGGQVLDCLTTNRSEELFKRIHILKTARLFEFCTYAVACVQGLDSNKLLEFGDFGKSLGLLFQLQDDLLDEEKKDEREEENILSILSREQLVAKINSQKKISLDFMSVLNIPPDGAFMKVVNKLFEREF